MKLTVSVCLLVIVLALVFPAAAQEGGLLLTITPRNADRVVELAMLTQDALGVLTWTPDGTLAVTGIPGVWLYDTTHLEAEPSLLAGEPDTVAALAVSPTGILAAATDTTVHVWTLDDPEGEPRTLDIAPNIVYLAFNPAGQLAAVTADGSVYLADPVSGEAQHLPDRYPGAPTDLVFSPDGAWLAVCGAEDLYVWEAASGRLHRQDQGAGCAFSPDGALLVTVGAAGAVELRDPASGAVVTAIDAGSGVSALAFSGSLLAAGSADGTVSLWDIETGTQRRTLAGHTGTILQLAFSPDGSQLASRDGDNTIRLWGLVAFASSAPTDLVIGATATVHVTGNDVLNVRGGAGVNFAVLDELPDSTPVTILGGPVYADGFTWWRLRTPDGIEGWAVDYADGVQTLVP
jgi:WD40 repeat protein